MTLQAGSEKFMKFRDSEKFIKFRDETHFKIQAPDLHLPPAPQSKAKKKKKSFPRILLQERDQLVV